MGCCGFSPAIPTTNCMERMERELAYIYFNVYIYVLRYVHFRSYFLRVSIVSSAS
jgi:hypothetical protein